MNETTPGFQHKFERFTGTASIASFASSALASVLERDTTSNILLNGGIVLGAARGLSKLISYTGSQLTKALSVK